MSKIVIVIDRGMVQDVFTDEPCTVLICDKDMDGAEATSIMAFPYIDECMPSSCSASCERAFVEGVFASWNSSACPVCHRECSPNHVCGAGMA
jgi:hypothetical protein